MSFTEFLIDLVSRLDSDLQFLFQKRQFATLPGSSNLASLTSAAGSWKHLVRSVIYHSLNFARSLALPILLGITRQMRITLVLTHWAHDSMPEGGRTPSYTLTMDCLCARGYLLKKSRPIVSHFPVLSRLSDWQKMTRNGESNSRDSRLIGFEGVLTLSSRVLSTRLETREDK